MGPLAGMKIVEIAGIGPGPFCAMLLADLGAEVLRIDRQVPSGLGRPRPLKYNLAFRNRKVIALDLKNPLAIELTLKLTGKAEALIEGFRPGVMERLGLGPEKCLKVNPKLVYGRLTGWGQQGPLSQAAGHDLNYIALPGALGLFGHKDTAPSWPLNLVGDFAGGSLYLALGIMCAIYETRRSGKGQVVDAAIVDGVANLLTSAFGLQQAGLLGERGTSSSSGGAYFYNAYQCKDGKWITVGSIEGKFHAELLKRIGLSPEEVGTQWDENNWECAKKLFAAKFKERTRDEWSAILEGSDACFAPVLSIEEVPKHPHMKAREMFAEIAGVTQPLSAPKFSRSVPPTPTPPESPDPAQFEAILEEWIGKDEVASYKKAGIFDYQASSQ